jgi:hypothetical protein
LPNEAQKFALKSKKSYTLDLNSGKFGILIAHSLYKNKRDYVRNFSNQEEIKMG